MPTERTRRSVLAAGTGLVAAIAGCSGTGDGGSTPGDATSGGPTTGTVPGTATTAGTDASTTRGDVSTVRPLTDAYEVGGLRVAFRDAWVQRSVLYRDRSGAVGVAAPGDRQFVFVEAAVEPGTDGAPAPGDFAVRVRADATVGTDSPVDGTTVLPDGSPEPGAYDPDAGRGWIAFPLPRPLPPGDPRLVVHPPGTGRETVVWGLPGTVATALRAPPASFSLSAVEVPDRVAPGDPIPLSVTVDNGGDGDGVCRLACTVADAAGRATGPSRPEATGRLPVPAGAARTWDPRLANPVDADDAPGRLSLSLSTAAGERRVEVAVEA